MVNQLKHKRISDIVSRHYVFAYVLYFFGIEFFDHGNKTLEELCLEQDIELEMLLESLASFYETSGFDKIRLEVIPIELVIDYLKHSHEVFIEKRLPFLGHLVEKLNPPGWNNHLITEIKLAFPQFVENLKKHILEKQETILPQIIYMIHQQKGIDDLYPVFSLMNDMSIAAYSNEHVNNEYATLDHLRRLTNGFTLWDEKDIQMKILMEELKSFNRELNIHSKIEHQILFPKATMLEKKLWSMVHQYAALN
jgi:regulator of cell morphogenesis and NO signaling